jgi:FtsH-binding integral membrane protein
MAFAQQNARPIQGAVATLGVSDRVTFLRKTYAHLGVALIAFAAITAFMMRYMTETSLKFSSMAMGGRLSWFIVLALFIIVGVVAQRLAMSQTSRGLQYLGLGIFVIAEAVILQPLLWIAIFRFGNAQMFIAGAEGGLGGAGALILQAAVITIAIFVGLTLTVFITKKDFSFLRGALTIGSFALLGVILASLLFGFSLGALFCGFVILLLAGYILYQTTLVMSYFPPSGYVAGALMLFSTIATLFWYVLQLMMSLRSNN